MSLLKTWVLCLSVITMPVGSLWAQSSNSERFRSNRGAGPVGNENSAHAQEVSMGQPRLAGNGCRRGTAAAVLSPDKRSLSLIFDQFVVEVGEGHGRQRERKNCELHIPFEVPRHLQMAVIRMDYRGFNFLPEGAQATLRAWYKYTGPGSPLRGAPITRFEQFTGPIQSPYDLTSQITAPVWSECGRKFNLVSHTQLSAQTNRDNEAALATVDSLDTVVRDHVVYHLMWRECRGQRGRR